MSGQVMSQKRSKSSGRLPKMLGRDVAKRKKANYFSQFQSVVI